MARPADRRPPPSGLIPLTCNEVQHLFAVQVARPVGITATGCAGRSGDADIKPAPVPATTDHRLPGNREDHDLRLEVCHERGRGLDVGSARGSGAVQEMRVWPFGVALRGEASNHHLLRWLKTVVVSDVEKAHVMRQVGIRKTVRSPRCGIAVDVPLCR
jgi:hypothetical protein